jgi:hypothetical protein
VEGSRFDVGKLKDGKARLTDDLWKVIGHHVVELPCPLMQSLSVQAYGRLT